MKYIYWLTCLWQIGNDKRRQACIVAGGAEALYRMSEEELRALHLFTDVEIDCLLGNRRAFDLAGEWAAFQKKEMRLVPYDDPDYPERLRTIHNAPYALFVKGRLPDPKRRSLAVVGARGCSEYGRSVARMLGRTMAKYDVDVISGMALGVDSASHAGALEADGDTYAVLGCGCDICYPRTSIHIYENILDDHGGILSEYAPGVEPQTFFFPMRNRIISALSDILIVVEARERSGSLITADFALEQGKDVYAVPGRYLDPLSVGCNHLIEQGAGIFVDMDSFLKNTGITPRRKQRGKTKEKLALEKEETIVYSCLDLDPKGIDEILSETDLDLLCTLSALDGLKEKRLVQETFQNYFCKTL